MSQRCLDCNAVLADDPADYSAVTRCAKCQRAAVREQQQADRADEAPRRRARATDQFGTPEVSTGPTPADASQHVPRPEDVQAAREAAAADEPDDEPAPRRRRD